MKKYYWDVCECCKISDYTWLVIKAESYSHLINILTLDGDIIEIISVIKEYLRDDGEEVVFIHNQISENTFLYNKYIAYKR